VQVCRSLACEMCASKELTKHVQETLGVEVGETTADGKFTLVELECLGSCGTAPAVMVNEVLHENVTKEQVDGILEKLPEEPPQFKDPSIDWEMGEH